MYTVLIIAEFNDVIFLMQGGQYMLDLVDHFGGTFVIFVFAILEVFAVVYLYGKFVSNIH